MKVLPRILAVEDELDSPPIQVAVRSPVEPRSSPLPIGWVAGLAIVTITTRLGYLFFFTNPENAGEGFTDAYHHGRSPT